MGFRRTTTVPAGRERAGVLTLQMVVREARWAPEGPRGATIVVPAFAEEGKPARVPGPLIRVPRGTEIAVSVRNALEDSTIYVHGLVTRPAQNDSVAVKPGETRSFRFPAGEPGTYFYYANFGDARDREWETMAGAFIVDSTNARPRDRVFVLNIFGTPVDSTTYPNALAINGYAWPHTERVKAKIGDTLRWRVINASVRDHPMHLHGFYFNTDSYGNAFRDTIFTRELRRFGVTEHMRPRSTMALSFTPDRAGNWLFHCHLSFHVVPEAAALTSQKHEHALSSDAGVHMAGLVLGIEVQGSPVKAAETPARRLHLFVQEGKPFGRAKRGLGFVLQHGERRPPADSIELPGSTIVLTRGQQTDIVVVNRLREATGVHWHGIELESPSDGVVGWSGAGARLAPAIAPSDSFTAHLTLPRAGTFIYHTHLNDLEQLSSGLYGALIVLEPGQAYDPTTDHVFIAGWNSTIDPPRILINGDSLNARPLEWKAGLTHRLRLINIGLANSLTFTLRADSTLQKWRPLAKDGADLPAYQAEERPSRQLVRIGETHDFAYAPMAGTYNLVVSHSQLGTLYRQTIVAH